MTTTKITSVSIKTDDLKGSGSVEFNELTNQRIGSLKLTWNGGSLSFSSISEYQLFLSQVIVPLTNSVNSPSGTGTGYVTASSGTVGSDRVTD